MLVDTAEIGMKPQFYSVPRGVLQSDAMQRDAMSRHIHKLDIFCNW